MSGRSSPVLTSSTQPTAVKSQELRAKIGVFKNILSEAGVSLSFNESPHVLTQEQSLVVRDMGRSFINSEKNIEEFIKGLKLLCKKEKYFRKCLLPSRFRKITDANETISTTLDIQQESLFRIFLRINHLQKQVTDILLDEITTISSEEMQDTSWLRLLLNPLRYLPYIKEPENLRTKLLDVVDIATFPAQLEILDSIPEIIPDSEYSETVKELSRLLDTNDELSGAIIDCFNALDLDSEVRAHVQDRILAKLLSGTSLKTFPVLLQFLLTDCKSQNLIGTLIKVRNALDAIMPSVEKNTEKESCKIMIFTRLQAFAIAPKSVTEAWLNMISAIKVHSDHRPIDYLILFMLHNTAKFKKRIIEAIFRKRVHAGLFKISLLEKMFEKYIPQQLLKDYFDSIVEIGCSLLRLSNGQHTVVQFATTLFRILFNHEYTEIIYRREILDSLILLTGVGDKTTVSCVLKIISLLLVDSNKLQQHTVLLMRLLEKINTFELKDVKEVFEILCKLTCGEQAEESMSGLKDEIHMIVRKQLSSCKRNIKHRGIISAVVMVKHICLKSEEQMDVDLPYSSDSPITIALLPRGPAREAACLLELTSTSTGGCSEFMGLYYDQLASMLSSTMHLDKYFMAWLHETITADFENTYVTQSLPGSVNDLQFSMQYLLNTTQELDRPLGVNIGGLTTDNGSGLILLLASHFRLLRLVHYRQQAGDLSSIDALLGSAVILPVIEDVADLDTDQVQQVATSLFHCVNWFREVINGFVTQKNKKLRAKVVQRVQDLIEVQKKLQTCMERIPDHKLPVSYFDSLSEVNKQQTTPNKVYKVKNPKKKFKSSAMVTETDDTVATTSAATQTKKQKPTSKADASELHVSFRQMDTDLALLFKYPLKFEKDNVEQYSTQTATLTIDQLKFMLNDYVSKLAILTQGQDVGLSHLNVVSPMAAMNDLQVILPHLNSHFKVLVNKINKLLETTDGRHDLPEMFTDEALDIKTCFGLILEVFYLAFSWSGFQHSSNLDLLKDLLKSMRPAQSQTLNSANKLISEFINRIASHFEQCLQLSHAVSLVKTMEALYSTTVPTPEVGKKIIATAGKLLSQRWYNSKNVLDVGKSCNTNIDVLVKVYLKGANIETLNGLVGTLQEQAPNLATKDDCLHMLASIDKQNFHIFYMGLCSALLNRVKTEIQSLTNTQHLTLWKTTALTLQGLMTVAKARESKINLVCFLKKSIGILNVFISQGIPIMEIMLRKKPDEVVAILKTLQTTTRFLHHLCCYSKFAKDVSLVAHVPRFRLILETLVYKVKAALVANNCSAAFWMGTLRNRDLQGDDILSQSTSITEDTNQNSDEQELPEDDSDEDALVIDENASNSGNRSAGSEVFD